MRKLLILAIFAPVLAIAQSTPPTVITTAVDSHFDASQVVTQRIGIAHDLFGKKGLDIDVRGFGGIQFKHGNLTGGLSLGPVVPLRIAREVTIGAAIFAGTTATRKLNGGLILTFAFNFAPNSSFQFAPIVGKAPGLSLGYTARF